MVGGLCSSAECLCVLWISHRRAWALMPSIASTSQAGQRDVELSGCPIMLHSELLNKLMHGELS